MMPVDMSPSPACYTLIKGFESLRLRAYPDPKTKGAPWSCGYGHTRGVTPDTICTEPVANDWLIQDVAAAVSIVKAVVRVPLTQGQFDALTSIIFNVGHGMAGDHGRDGIVILKSGNPSTLLRKLNAGDYAGAGFQFLLWDSPGSDVQAGLDRRRRAELKLWQS